MNRRVARKWGGLLFVLLMVANASASLDTIGPNGIDSQNLGLTGDGISIGQVEAERPGMPGFDNASNSNFWTNPAGVFIENGTIPPTANSAVEIYFEDPPNPPRAHATWVAGVMIGNDPVAPGVAGEADLYASLGNNDPMAPGNPTWALDEKLAMAAQHVATRSNGDIRAINMSFLITLAAGEIPDGNSLLTQFVDWSASRYQHDVLYVVAWREQKEPPLAFNAIVPADNFNGMTVAASEKVSGVYRRVGAFNLYDQGLTGGRTAVDILAPGEDVEVADVGGPIPPPTRSGTTYAAPHVAGTVALLQEHAESQIGASAPRWDADARRHQVMKAVLMNSADKIEDDGALAPVGSFLGMTRTVLKQNGADTWLDSNAYTNQAIPLDIEMGTGHLNASRALAQFSPGEYDSAGTATVPLVGWDYGFVNDLDTTHKYVFDQELPAGRYVSITLAWDRELVIDFDVTNPGAWDPGETFDDFGFYDVNLYLLPAGATDTSSAIWASTSTASNLEHIFREIPATGDYELWVQMDDPRFFSDTNYAVAWWAAAAAAPVPGDYDGNGSVGPEDYNLWKADFGSTSQLAADGNNNGIVDAADYTVWRDNLGAIGSGSLTAATVPEPAAWLVLAMGTLGVGWVRRRTAPQHCTGR